MKSTSNLVFKNNPVDIKIKLSAFWVTLMFFYIYADILGFYSPGIIESVISGEIAGIQLTEGYLLVMGLWMAVPSLMVILSLVLRAGINRWVNLIFAVVSFFMLAASSFVGEFSIRYTTQAAVEAILIVLIAWNAWNWPKEQAVQ
jgi:hypothetical protein